MVCLQQSNNPLHADAKNADVLKIYNYNIDNNKR